MSDTSTHADLMGPVDLLADVPIASPAEYIPAPPARPREIVRTIVMPPDPQASGQKYLKLYTQNKIREAFHNLTMEVLPEVLAALRKVGEDSPARMVELFLDMAKFSLPQLKETSVNVTQNGATRTYSIQELEQELAKPD